MIDYVPAKQVAHGVAGAQLRGMVIIIFVQHELRAVLSHLGRSDHR